MTNGENKNSDKGGEQKLPLDNLRSFVYDKNN